MEGTEVQTEPQTGQQTETGTQPGTHTPQKKKRENVGKHQHAPAYINGETRTNPLTRGRVDIGTSSISNYLSSISDIISACEAEREIIDCDYCEGNESHTAPEVFRMNEGLRRANSPGWRVRVVPNKHPRLMIEGNLDGEGSGIYDWTRPVGAHEVIIMSPDHQKTIYSLDRRELTDILEAIKARALDLYGDRRMKHISVAGDYGVSNGKKNKHAHMDLIARPHLSEDWKNMAKIFKDHYQQKERCMICDMVMQEEKKNGGNERMISTNDYGILMVPFAPSAVGEMMIIPRQHQPYFYDAGEAAIRGFADLIHTSLQAVQKGFGRIPLMWYVDIGPRKDAEASKPELRVDDSRGIKDYTHVMIKIVPHTRDPDAIERAAGTSFCPVRPEETAFYLKDSLNKK